MEGLIKHKDLSPVDAVVITHDHGDHYWPDDLKQIINKDVPVITNEELVDKIRDDGFNAQALRVGEKIEIVGFTIKSLLNSHATLPFPTPVNMSVLIDDRVVHPGDSIDFEIDKPVEVLALPYAGPFMTIGKAVDCVKRIKPWFVIPVHDAHYKDFFREGQEKRLEQSIDLEEVTVQVLGLGDVLEI